jgi:RNA polymerase sigma factor (sigma-70 family)
VRLPIAGGADFDRFARFRVRRAIRNALTDQSRLVRLPKHIVERRRALSLAMNGRTQSPVALADATALPLRVVTQALNAAVTTASLDVVAGSEADPGATDPERIAIEHDDARRLGAALAGLPSRQRQIVSRTFGLEAPPQRLSAVASDVSLSRERTRSILRDALAALRAALAPTRGR